MSIREYQMANDIPLDRLERLSQHPAQSLAGTEGDDGLLRVGSLGHPAARSAQLAFDDQGIDLLDLALPEGLDGLLDLYLGRVPIHLERVLVEALQEGA